MSRCMAKEFRFQVRQPRRCVTRKQRQMAATDYEFARGVNQLQKRFQQQPQFAQFAGMVNARHFRNVHAQGPRVLHLL
ncbi:MAG: hypothetical protein RLY70_4899 [Planctomycetota bacterium]|jgi:hypothetical protein